MFLLISKLRGVTLNTPALSNRYMRPVWSITCGGWSDIDESFCKHGSTKVAWLSDCVLCVSNVFFGCQLASRVLDGVPVSVTFCSIMSPVQTCRFSPLMSQCDAWEAFAVFASPSFMWCLALVETSPLELYYVVARQQSDLKCQPIQTGSEASSDFSCAFGGCRLQTLH